MLKSVFVLIITGCKKLMQITKCLHCTARNVFCMYCKNCNKCFGVSRDIQNPPIAVPTKLKTALNYETHVICNVVDIFSFYICKYINCNTNSPCLFPCHYMFPCQNYLLHNLLLNTTANFKTS
jgi:hypothetical protein